MAQATKKDQGNPGTQGGSDLASKAQDVLHSATETAKNIGNTAVSAADSAASTVGGGVKSAADAVRSYGPQSGMLGSATSGVAGALDSAGKYLQEEGVSGMAEDVTDMIRRHPIPALLVGIGIGYLLARVTGS